MQTGATIQELFPTFVLGLDELEVEVLADLVEPRRIPAETQVIAYGQTSSELWVVLDGALQVSVPPDIVLGVKGRREWVGDLGLIQPGPAPVDVRAWGDVDALVLTRGAVQRLWSHPRIVGHLWRALARTLAARIRACAALGPVNAEDRARKLQQALAILHGMPPVHEPSTWTPSTTTYS